MKEFIYRKGDVFLADLGIPHGSEQGGRRPVVIIQNDDGCVYSPTVTMVPMTTAIKKPFQKSHYILRYSDCIRYRSMVEAEQIQTIDKDRIIRRIGHLDPRDISGIEEAMRNHFGFDMITESEYSRIKKKLQKDYKVPSDILADFESRDVR